MCIYILCCTKNSTDWDTFHFIIVHCIRKEFIFLKCSTGLEYDIAPVYLSFIPNTHIFRHPTFVFFPNPSSCVFSLRMNQLNNLCCSCSFRLSSESSTGKLHMKGTTFLKLKKYVRVR